MKKDITISNQIKKNPAFKDWKADCKKKNIKIKNIDFISYFKRKDTDFCISTIDTTIKYKKKTYNRAIQFEGSSAVIIPILVNNDKIYTILVSQFRVPICGLNYEFPSGKINNKNNKKSIQNEISEELNLKINLKSILQINKKPIFMLPANNFSKVFFYYFRLKVDKKFINRYDNKITGVHADGEYLKTKIIEFNKILSFTNSASVILGHSLIKSYEKIF